MGSSLEIWRESISLELQSPLSEIAYKKANRVLRNIKAAFDNFDVLVSTGKSKWAIITDLPYFIECLPDDLESLLCSDLLTRFTVTRKIDFIKWYLANKEFWTLRSRKMVISIVSTETSRHVLKWRDLETDKDFVHMVVSEPTCIHDVLAVFERTRLPYNDPLFIFYKRLADEHETT